MRCVVTPLAFPPQGRPGAQGPQGSPGVAGSVGSYGLGQITYTERELEASDTFEPGVRGQVLFEPTSVQDYLNPPFAGHGFWTANRIVPRALGDLQAGTHRVPRTHPSAGTRPI